MGIGRRAGLLVGAALLAAAVAAVPAVASPRPHAAVYVELTLTRAGTTGETYATIGSSCASACVSLLRVSEDGLRVTRVTLPPLEPSSGTIDGGLLRLAFANARDGVAVIGSYLGPEATYVTTNGAASWSSTPLHGLSVLSIATTATTYDLVAERCTPGRTICRGARLLSSPVTSIDWRTTPLPDAAGIGTFGASVAAFANDVWVDEATTKGAPRIATSRDGGATFSVRTQPTLVAINTCALEATSPYSVWARCPTGMLQSFFHSTDGGTRWRAIELGESSGTSGSQFDPVASDLCYFASGLPNHELDRISGDTSRVRLVHHLPIAGVEGLVFVNREDGLASGSTTASTSAILARTADGGRTWEQVPLP